jgi:hypothetical protein
LRDRFAILMRILLAVLIVAAKARAGQNGHGQPVPSIPATSANARLTIDGRLDEDSWSLVSAIGGFRQRDPNENETVSERTQVRILYDSRAIYVGAELFDSDASRIVARSSRRDDNQDSDYFQLYLDPYHDHLTGAMFQVSASGAQKDCAISNDTSQDISWDAVWDSAVTRNESGWFLEMRIPVSQLRFANSDQQTWGINLTRFIHRKNETAWFELVPKDETGLASRMAHLTGLDGIEARHNLEIMPYVRSSAEFEPPVAGNPFRDGSRFLGGSGVDIKYGLSSNLTLNATINPDFGQVEVDPAVVNLSAFETFFQERRPFFVEGAQVFNNFGRLGNGGGSLVFPNYFY